MPWRDGLKIWKILKKIQLGSDHDVEKLSSDHGAEKLGSDHGVEKLRSDHGFEKLGFRALRHMVEFFGSFPREIFKIPRYVPNVEGGVSIVSLQKTFKNCASLLVSKNWRQKFINRSFLNNRARLCICIVWLAYVLRLYNIFNLRQPYFMQGIVILLPFSMLNPFLLFGNYINFRINCIRQEYLIQYKCVQTMDYYNRHINFRGCPRGVMVKATDYGIVVALLRSLSGKYPWERYKPPYPPSYGLNSTTTVLLWEWLWH